MPEQTVSYQQVFALLRRYLSAEWLLATLLFVLLLSGIALQLLQPQVLRDFIDLATGEIASTRLGDVTSLTTIAIIFIIVAIVNQLLLAAAAYVTQDVRWRTTNRLRADLARHALSLDMGFHNDHSAGELVSRIDGDVDALSNFFSQFVIQVIGNGLLIIGVIGVLTVEDWRIGIGFAAFVVVATIFLRRTVGLAAPWIKKLWEEFGKFYGFSEERFAALEDIRGNGAVSYTMKRWHDIRRIIFRVDRNAFLLLQIPASITLGMFSVGTALGLGLGGVLYWRGLITLGSVYIIITYAQLIQNPLRLLTEQVQDFQRAAGAADRIQTLYQVQSRLSQNADSTHALPNAAPTIAFEQVDFHYVESAPILRDVSFAVPAGEVLGLLGRTGCGKTTLVRLLFRLYDVVGGEITIDGTDIATVPLRKLRRYIGMVTQDVQLFNATIRDNLTFFDRSIADEAILASIDALGLGEWFGRLEDGLDTLIGAGGRGLSAGEAQLLAFARIFLQDPHIIILDEASSRLDPATERLIERAIDKLLHNRTAIIIAHRLNTVQRADAILILSNGEVAEFGRRTTLANDPTSQFAQLLATGATEVLT